VLAIGTAIHIGIGAFMGMWTFGLSMIFAYVAFLPGARLSAIANWMAQQIGRAVRWLGLGPGLSASIRARAIWFAFGFDGNSQPSLAPAPLSSPETTVEVAVAGDHEVAPRPLVTTSGSGRVVDVASNGRHQLPALRPAILLVEGRLKRQSEVQEYFLNHGFRCHVASELHQARSMLSVIEFDALVVTSSWFSEGELVAFHEGLIDGGPALPASVFLVGTGHGEALPNFRQTPRHRVLVGSLSLRELRLLVVEVLGLTEESLRPVATRRSRSRNGHRAPTAPDPTPKAEQAPKQPPIDVPSTSGGNGSLP
jgi:hypothetical protein